MNYQQEKGKYSKMFQGILNCISQPIEIASPYHTHNGKQVRVALCAIAKMENVYVREWLDHYRKLGVNKVYLYDNNDVDGERFSNVLKDDYKDFVKIIDVRGKPQYQMKAYEHCYNKYHKDYDWMMFFDLDEFLVLHKDKTIQQYLDRCIFNEYNCIKVFWKQFTDNGISRIDGDNYSIKRFTQCIDDVKSISQGSKLCSRQSKSILRCKFEKVKFVNPHCASQIDGKMIGCCNPVGEHCQNTIISSNFTWGMAELRHYRFKTMQEYIRFKMVRLWPTNFAGGGKKLLNKKTFFTYNDNSQKRRDEFDKILKEEREIAKRKQ